MKKFSVDSISRSVDIEKIKNSQTPTYIEKFTGKGGGTVVNIPLTAIDDFPNHPFRVIDDQDMQDLTESIKANGVLTPVILRQKEGGRYELISGHRRRRASCLAGLKEIPANVVEMTDDEATVAMVDANLQREKILPSEKAFAYKMKLEAISRQGKRNDLTTSRQLGTKLRSDEQIADETGESARQIQRYVRLTNLVPELMQSVDEEKIPLTVAVELSYLMTDEQYSINEYVKKGKAPSLRQAAELKHLSKAKIFDNDSAQRVMFPLKEEKISDVSEKLKKIIEKHDEKMRNWDGVDNQIMKGYILNAFNQWNAEYPDKAISRDFLDSLLTGLKWATDDLTAEEAYRYYQSH